MNIVKTIGLMAILGLMLSPGAAWADKTPAAKKPAKAPAARPAAPVARRPAAPAAKRPTPAARRPAPAARRAAPATRRPAPVTKRTAPTKRAKAAPATRAQAASKAQRGDPKETFAQANKLYNAGEYGKAAALFRDLATKSGWQHFSLFYNLGNSYFRLQHYGKALAYYRKAQRLRPNDTDLLHNIQLLYKRVGKGEQDQPQLRIKSLFWYYLLNLKQLFFVVIFLTYLFLLLWAMHIRRKARQTEEKGALRWFLVGLAAVMLVMWLSLGIKVYREQIRQVGVITKERVSARSGYGKHYEPMFWLSEADEVIIKEKIDLTGRDGARATWLRIELRLFDKKKKRRVQKMGWIPARALQRI